MASELSRSLRSWFNERKSKDDQKQDEQFDQSANSNTSTRSISGNINTNMSISGNINTNMSSNMSSNTNMNTNMSANPNTTTTTTTTTTTKHTYKTSSPKACTSIVHTPTGTNGVGSVSAKNSSAASSLKGSSYNDLNQLAREHEERERQVATEFFPAARIATLTEPTVWHFFTPLAQTVGAINLSQGYPSFSPPVFVQEAAVRAVTEQGTSYLANQYARSAGDMALVKVLAERYAKTLKRTIDPLTEVVVTDGASGALFNAIEGLVNRGDEVIVFEPAFDIYIAQISLAGGVLKPVPLHVLTTTDACWTWSFDVHDLERAFTPRTRVLILNTPHNPTGKIFSLAELQLIAQLVQKWPRVVVLSDEVYEHMCFERPHISIASLPGMWERTMTISSAGKTFACTGWKIGWVIAPPHLARSVAVTQQWVVFSVATPLQLAIADALCDADKPYEGYPSYWEYLRDMYRQRRDRFVDILREVGLLPVVPEGGFFVVAITSKVDFPIDPTLRHLPRDWQFAKWLTVDIGVAAIPPSSFFSASNRHLAANQARFAFCKPDDMLVEAGLRLQKLKPFLRTSTPVMSVVDASNIDISKEI